MTQDDLGWLETNWMTQSDLEWPRTAMEIVWMTQYDFRCVKSTSTGSVNSNWCISDYGEGFTRGFDTQNYPKLQASLGTQPENTHRIQRQTQPNPYPWIFSGNTLGYPWVPTLNFYPWVPWVPDLILYPWVPWDDLRADRLAGPCASTVNYILQALLL